VALSLLCWCCTVGLEGWGSCVGVATCSPQSYSDDVIVILCIGYCLILFC